MWDTYILDITDIYLCLYVAPEPTINTETTNLPTKSPTKMATDTPTKTPTEIPTITPTKLPTTNPTKSPTNNPGKIGITPSTFPSETSALVPTSNPSMEPTLIETLNNINVTQIPIIIEKTGTPTTNPTEV